MGLRPRQSHDPARQRRLQWVIYSLSRLVGLAAIVWSFAAQAQQLVDDVRAPESQLDDPIPTSTASMATSIASAMATSSSATRSVTTSIISLDIQSLLTAQATESITVTGGSKDIPLTVYPQVKRAMPTSMPVERMARRDDDEDVLEANGHASQDRATVAAADVLNLLALCVALFAQLGVPETFIVRHCTALSPISGPGWLGTLKVWLAVHALASLSGAVDVMVALLLAWSHARTIRYRLPLEGDPYLHYALAARLAIWKPLPDVAIFTIAMRRSVASGDFAASDDEAEPVQPEKSTSGSGYPTFRGQGLGDVRPQIPGRTSNRLSTVDEEEDLEAQMFEVEPLTPQRHHRSDSGVLSASSSHSGAKHTRSRSHDEASASLGSVPAPFHDIFKGMRPRFSTASEATQYLPDLPTFNVMPATPSTIASRSRRRETRQSAMTVGSARSSLSNKSGATSTSFPAPPRRPSLPPHADTFGNDHRRSSSSSSKKPASLDANKLMPPTSHKKSVRRPASGHTRTLTPPRPLSEVEEPADKSTRAARTRSVRFDLRRDSSSSSASASDLEGLLPPKKQQRQPHDPFADGADERQYDRLASAAGL